MRIGDVAATVGVTAQTIRFYERTGLLPPPQRTPNGYRTYDEQTVARLRFIRNGQGAGLTLLEITAIIDLRGAGTTPCAHVSELLSARLQDVHARQRELAVLDAELQGLISRGRRLDPDDCTDTEICHLVAPPPPSPAHRIDDQVRSQEKRLLWSSIRHCAGLRWGDSASS